MIDVVSRLFRDCQGCCNLTESVLASDAAQGLSLGKEQLL